MPADAKKTREEPAAAGEFLPQRISPFRRAGRAFLRLVEPARRAPEDEEPDDDEAPEGADAEGKDDDDAEEERSGLGEVEAVACTYDPPEEPDDYGTVFGEGCFDRRADEHREGIKPIKMLWKHRKEFGLTTEIDTKGELHVFGKPVEEDPKNAVRMAYVRDKVVDGASIGFDHWLSRYEVLNDILDPVWGWPVWRYTDVEILEWSPVLWGAVKKAHIVGVREQHALHDAVRSAKPSTIPEQLRALSLALVETYALNARHAQATPEGSIDRYILEQAMASVRLAHAMACGKGFEEAYAEMERQMHKAEARATDDALGFVEERLARLEAELSILRAPSPEDTRTTVAVSPPPVVRQDAVQAEPAAEPEASAAPEASTETEAEASVDEIEAEIAALEAELELAEIEAELAALEAEAASNQDAETETETPTTDEDAGDIEALIAEVDDLLADSDELVA